MELHEHIDLGNVVVATVAYEDITQPVVGHTHD